MVVPIEAKPSERAFEVALPLTYLLLAPTVLKAAEWTITRACHTVQIFKFFDETGRISCNPLLPFQ